MREVKLNDTKILILAMLRNESLTGYDLAKVINARHYAKISFQLVYRNLKSLNEANLIGYDINEQFGRPSKKTYSLTEIGSKMLDRETDKLTTAYDPYADKDNLTSTSALLTGKIDHFVHKKNLMQEVISRMQNELKIISDPFTAILIRKQILLAEARLKAANESIELIESGQCSASI